MKITGFADTLNQSVVTQAATNSQQDFNRLLNDAKNGKKEKELKTACEQLEAVFINKVMDSMRAAIPRSELINRGFATDVWESMLFEKYADLMSKTGSIGIAKTLYKQLSAHI